MTEMFLFVSLFMEQNTNTKFSGISIFQFLRVNSIVYFHEKEKYLGFVCQYYYEYLFKIKEIDVYI